MYTHDCDLPARVHSRRLRRESSFASCIRRALNVFVYVTAFPQDL